MPRLNQSGFLAPVVSVVTLEETSILFLVIIASFHFGTPQYYYAGQYRNYFDHQTIRDALGQLVVLSECVCPGRELRLECTVVGGFGTTWRGTAFDYLGWGDEIFLRHSQFESGTATRECNNGMIIGHSHNRTFDGPNSTFTSQLIIHLTSVNATSNTLEGRTVECIRSSETVDVVGTHTIVYTRISNSPPPDNVHVAQVSRKALIFQWDPVQSMCSDIEYKVNATNCGICPDITVNTSVACMVNTILMITNNLVCTLSVETTVCGFQSNKSEAATALLKAPDRPNISKVLPYYNSSSRQLIRIDIQVESNEERFYISEGINGSVTSYTFDISFSDSESNCTSPTAVIPVSSCVAGVCTITLTSLISLPCYKHSSQAEVVVYASNLLTDGPPSTTLLNTLNSLFFTEYEQLSNSFSCWFVGRVYENKSCEISYGAMDPTSQLCPLDNQVTQHVNSSRISDTMTVFIPKLEHAGSEFCFTAVGKTSLFTIAVEGTFRTGNQPINEVLQIDAISGVSISFVVLLAALSATLIVVIVLLARSRARALKELNLLREDGKRLNVAYEEINLTESAIDTSKNVAYGHISIK